jgi:two-component system, NtrC family, C4-dicarboxylate transport sensor histidine kinase DctB
LGTLCSLMVFKSTPWRLFRRPGAEAAAHLTWITAVLVVLGAWLSHGLSERAGLAQLAAVSNERLELYASTLDTELARYRYLPSLVAIEPDVGQVLLHPDDPAVGQRADLRLSRINARAGSVLIRVADLAGQELASSDHYGPARAGVHAADLPPWPELPAEGVTGFFDVAPDASRTDYYFVQAILRGGQAVGKVMVKVSLAPLEATWVDLGLRTESEKLVVVDAHERVVMSSIPSWKRKILRPTAGVMPGDPSTGQEPALLRVSAERLTPYGGALVSVSEGGAVQRSQYLAQERAVLPLAVHLVTLSDPSETWRRARVAAWGGGVAGAFVGVLALYLLHRRRALAELLQARNALQAAHDQLERQVQVRTQQLQTTNRELTREIEQRVLAEDELMQASKLAVLGQMSAGISHEINQPLTALRALSRNAVLLMAAGRTQAVSDNLKSIDAMVERMGRIVTQLKSFARKPQDQAASVEVAQAVRNVLLLLDHRQHAQGIEVQVDVATGLRAQGDPTRLEQVVMNLATNAMDAMVGQPERRLHIAAVHQDGRVRVQVSDSGTGVSDAAMAHLFEPFFTTKPAGQGLGLGLVISAQIVRELGGQLRARRLDSGMLFEFDLAAAPEDAPDV